MHWAAYKGHYKIVWMLLKENISPLDIDQHGNTAVHQAAAGGHYEVIECLLARGIDINIRNARGHTPFNLATEGRTRDLIKRALMTKYCASCSSKFTFQNLRYICMSSNDFFCFNCSATSWEFEKYDSIEKERPVCRSLEANKIINKHENSLREAMETDDYYSVDAAISEINNKRLDIDVKLKHEAELLHLKLEHELNIRTFIEEKLQYVEDFQKIKKLVNILNEKVQAAVDDNVDLD